MGDYVYTFSARIFTKCVHNLQSINDKGNIDDLKKIRKILTDSSAIPTFKATLFNLSVLDYLMREGDKNI